MKKTRWFRILLSTVLALALTTQGLPMGAAFAEAEPQAALNEPKNDASNASNAANAAAKAAAGPLVRPSTGMPRDQVLEYYGDGAYGDTTLSFEERAADLISRMTPEEKRAQLLAFWNSLDSSMAGAVPTLGILGNRWWKEALHGIAREGHATSFPSPLNMSSMWNPDLMLKIGVAASDEGRYHSNIGWNASQGNSLTYWSPTINLHRDPRWGRNEESMGEDPYLAGINATMFVSGMQGDERTAGIDPNYNSRYLKTSTAVKHFAANNSEVNRHGGDTVINDRTLREYYLKVFQNVVENTAVESTMTAYNKINGVPNAANTYLVDDLLRKTWGFDGHVVSDCGAVNDIAVGSNGFWSKVTGGDAAEKSTARSIRAGTDINCSFENQQVYLRNALPAIDLGYMSENDLDLALLHVFTERMRTGEFDPPEMNSYREIGRTGNSGYAANQYVSQSSFSALESDENLKLARQASVESLTLLKNDVPASPDYNGNALPVDLGAVPDNGSIVLVGDFANYLELGDYSRDLPTQLINNNDSNELHHIDTVARGLQRYIQNYNAKTGKNISLTQFQGNPSPKGQSGYMRNTRNFRFQYSGGKQVLTVNSSTEANVIGGCQKEGSNLGYVTDGSYAAFTSLDIENLTGITIETSGDSSTPGTVYVHFRVGSYSGPVLTTITSTRNSGDGWGSYRYYPAAQTANVNTAVLAEAIEKFGTAPEIYMVISSNSNPNAVEDVDNFADDFEAAKAAARTADLTVVVVGSGQSAPNLPGGYKLCGEGGDRESLKLPLMQGELAYEIGKVAKRSVVYMQSVGFHTVDKFIDDIDAFIFSSYNGQHQGWALPQIIFGDQNPSSRLAFTWYKDEAEVPNLFDYSLRAQPDGSGGYTNYGRTYQHFTGGVQWPFGFGLSYTNFEITNIQLDKNNAGVKDKVKVTFDLENKGNRPGAQTVQVYVTSPKAYKSGVRDYSYPVKQLSGFAHVQLGANEKKTGVSVEMDVNELCFFDTPDNSGFDAEFGRPVNPGKRVVYSGAYEIGVGTSSANIEKTLTLNVTGSAQPDGQAETGYRPWLKNADLRGTKVWTTPGTTVRSNLSVALSDEKLFDTDMRQLTAHVVGAQPAPKAISDLIGEIAAYANYTYKTSVYPVTVEFSSSNPEVASVNASTGLVTAVTYGVATITAKVTADGGEAFEASYPLVVNNVVPKMEEELPEPEGNLMIRVMPGAARTEFEVTLYDLANGTKQTPKSDGMSFDVKQGSYGYIIRAAGYANQIGTAEVDSKHTAENPLVVTATMAGGASAPLTLTGTGSDRLVSGTWGSNMTEIAQEYKNGNADPIILESYGFIGWMVGNSWVKFPNVNLMGGISGYTLRYGKDGSANMTFNVHIAPAGSPSPPSQAMPYPAIGDDLTFTQGSGWSNGINVTQSNINSTGQNAKGLYDVYARMPSSSGNYNIASLTLNLKPLDVIGVNTYDTAFSVRPYDAELVVTKLDGTSVYSGSGSKTVSLEEGFYRYSVSAAGYDAKQQLLLIADSPRKITTVLDPAGSAPVRYEAENARRTGGSAVNGSYSNGQAISGFTNVDFTVSRALTGIVRADVRYFGAASGNITVTANGEGAKTVPLNADGVSSVYVDMWGADNTVRISGVPGGFILDCIDVYSGTVSGSIDSDDQQRVPPGNPIIRSIFTADPEAKVWPNEPDKVYLYPSHDRWPTQGGCGRMDHYHVYSTVNMVDWIDEGEILRYDDLTASRDDPTTPYWNQLDRQAYSTDTSQSTLMWAPDAVYKDGWYYFYWPVPLKIGVALPGITAPNSWGSTWVTGVRRSRYPDRGFEEIPESEAYPGFPGYIEGLVGTDIDIAVRVYEDTVTGDEVPYFYVGGGQHYWQGILEDNMCEIKTIELVSCANNATCNTKGCLADPTPWYTPANTGWYTPSDYIKNKREAQGQTALGWAKTEKNINQAIPYYHEGPSMFRKAPDNPGGDAFKNGPLAKDLSEDGYVYYLIYPTSNSGGHPEVSSGGGDMFRYCTGPTPLGPWTSRGVYFDKVSTQSTSHGSVFEFKGKWYQAYHTADLYGGTGEVRSAAIDEITFNPDGTIKFFRATAEGVGQNGPAYTRPNGKIYSVAEAETIGTGWNKYEDPLNAANPQGGSTVITNMNANGRGIRFNNVDGGAAGASGSAGEGSRARIFFRYSTTDHLPKMELLVNGKSYSLINFTRTGGKTFFSDMDFTVKALKPGPNNTIELRIVTGITGDNNSLNANDIGGKINLNYIEVVLLDEAKDISVDERVVIRSASAVPGEGDSVFSPVFDVTAAEDVALSLIVAKYDASGRLVAADSDSAALSAGGKVSLQASVPYAKDDGMRYRFFIWDSGFVPLTAINDMSGLN